MNKPEFLEIQVLRDVVQKLEQAGIEYMITGSFAMGYHAEPRMTRDIDIVVEMSARQIDETARLFAKDFYVERSAIARAVEQKSMFNMIHFENVIKIDCIVSKDEEFEKLKFARRHRIEKDDLAFWIIGKEDLILSKLKWAKDSLSAIQLRDVANLLKSGYDEIYVQAWIDKLNLKAVWEKIPNE